ncbi:MAG: helix-turn-helix domain-containing protein [Candidatus Solibacter sp.]
MLNLIGDKWAMLIFPLLKQRPRRNSELLREVGGISQKVLTETLRDFEGHGLVLRKDYGTMPPKVDYRLTDLGHTLAEVMSMLDQWLVDHYHEVARARERYLRRSRRKNAVAAPIGHSAE